jgi:serpin B
MLTRLLRLTVVITLLAMSLSIASAQTEPPLPAPSDSAGFATSLYDQLRLNEGNLFFSPYSINTAFLMVYAGAGGATAQQIRDVLKISVTDDVLPQTVADYNNAILLNNNAVADDYTPERTLTVANALWLQQDFPLVPTYPELLQAFYNATISPMDFTSAPEESRQTINDTIAEQTNDRIQNLLPEGIIDEATRLILTNAVYFKANWAEEFTPLDSAPFTTSDGTVLDVPSMTLENRIVHVITDEYIAVALPYSGWTSDIVIIMPSDFATFEANLVTQNLNDLITNDTTFITDIKLTMPKFEFESSFGLSDALITLGMTDAFNADIADLSGMSAEALFIQEALHKAFIAVDENGTEAAAATAVIVGVTSMMPQPNEPLVINIDKPFLFYIRDVATHEILFMGRVLNPLE